MANKERATMIYVKKASRTLLILLYSVGVIPSSLHAAHGYKSLTAAMKAGDETAIQDFVKQQQTSPNLEDRFKYDALDTSLYAKSEAGKVFYGKTPLHKAASFFTDPNRPDPSYLDGVSTLLNALSPAQAKRIVNQRSERGHATPLHILAGHPDTAAKQQESRIKARPEDIKETRKPQERSSSDNAYRLAEILIDHGANVNEKDENGLTPLHWAVRHRNQRLVELLLHKGADAKIFDKSHKLPLHWAAMKGYIPIINLLLTETSDLINERDDRGRTPLLWVQRNREGATAYTDSPAYMTKKAALENIKLLLDNGADPTIKDNEDFDAFHWANDEEKALFNKFGFQQQQQPVFTEKQINDYDLEIQELSKTINQMYIKINNMGRTTESQDRKVSNALEKFKQARNQMETLLAKQQPTNQDIQQAAQLTEIIRQAKDDIDDVLVASTERY